MLDIKKYKKIEESDYEKFERLLNLHIEMGYRIVENSYEVKDESDSQVFSQQIVLDNDFSLDEVIEYLPGSDKEIFFGINIIEKNKPLLYKRSITKRIEWYDNYQLRRLQYDGRLKSWDKNGNRDQFHYFLEGYDEPNSRIDRVIYYYENGLEKEIQEYYEPRTESWDMTHHVFSRVYNYTTGWTSYTYHKVNGSKNEEINYKYEYHGGETGKQNSGTSYKHGPYKEFFDNKICYEGIYENGVKHGEFKGYIVINDDYLMKKENWNHGELIESISYNEDGSIKEVKNNK